MENTEIVNEFEEYLKSIGGLINGYFPDREAITSRYYFSVGDGWLLTIIKPLIEELIAAGWDKKILQVKEKFGTLRFYIPEESDEIYKIIEKYEELTENTCEICGTFDKENITVKSHNGWLSVKCDNCLKNKIK
jgi:hypothetical protein